MLKVEIFYKVIGGMQHEAASGIDWSTDVNQHALESLLGPLALPLGQKVELVQ